MKKIAAIAALALISACATSRPAEPIIKTVEVKVPVPVPCEAAGAVGPAPAYPDTNPALAAAVNIFERVKLLMAGRQERMKREDVLTSAIDSCDPE